MKNLVVFMVVAAVTVFATSENADAGGKNKGKIYVQNVNNAGGRAITCAVVPQNAIAGIRTKADISRYPRRNVRALKTESFSVNNGRYVVVAGDTQAWNSLRNNDAIPAGAFDTQTVIINNNRNVTLRTNTIGGPPIWRPNLF